jgi:hypothetical protein
MDLDQIIYEHAEWKSRFRQAISNHELMDETSASSDACCNLGQWLHGHGKQSFDHLDAFNELIQAHAAFHAEAGKVALFIKAGDVSSAEAALDYGSSYSRAAQAVAVAIMGFHENQK